MTDDRTAALADRLSRFDRLVEVGIGDRTTVAAALADRGCQVRATDVVDRSVPEAIEFVVDDVTDPTIARYQGVEAVYGLRLPPELQRPTAKIARSVDAVFLFTTLGGDPAVVPAVPEQLPGTTLHRAELDRLG